MWTRKSRTGRPGNPAIGGKTSGWATIVAHPVAVLRLVTFQRRLMAIDDHPLTVFNRQMENDKLAQPVGSGAIKGTAKVIGAISQIPALRPLGLIAKGLDLTGKCLMLGVPTIEENLKLFGGLVEGAILSVEERLNVLETSAEQFQRRVESKEFMQYLASGVLQTQRTTQENRLKRMAWIIANSVKENDLDPESGDDMMRAAVELKQTDLFLLRDMFDSESSLSAAISLRSEDDILFQYWQDYWDQVFPAKYPNWSQRATATGFGRLAALGLIYGAKPTNMGVSPVPTNYRISDEGKKFYERIQEIAV